MKLAMITKMSRIFHVVLVALLVACVHTAPASTPAAVATTGRPFLWTVEKGGRTHFLLGTIHAGIEASALSADVAKAFASTPCFVMESNQAAMVPEELSQMATLPKGENLRQQMTPTAWNKLVKALDGLLDPERLEHSRPWFVSLVYLQTIVPEDVAGMDGTFLNKARAAKKRVDFLEDWREAVSAFASVTDVHDLEDMIMNEDHAEDETKALVAAYRTGNEAELTKVTETINSDGLNAEAKLKVLLTDRNTLWLPRLTQTLDQSTCFVAVGVAHLLGKGNLRDLLTKAGYRVERVGGVSP